MIFTKQNSVKDILEYHLVKEYLPIFFPNFMLEIIPEEFKNKSLTDVERNVTLPWGSPFLSDMLVDAANMVVDIVENKSYVFIPLWEMQHDSYKPKIHKVSDKDGVCLIKSSKKYEQKRPAIIICPGGGYEALATNIEGMPIAKRMEEDGGYCAFVLNYRVKPNCYPEPQKDLVLAIQHVRANSERYGVDPDNIMIMGSSAGGHLCASIGALHEGIVIELQEDLKKSQLELAEKYRNISARPNKVCLNYPVVSFKREQHEGSFQALTGGDELLRERLSVENLVNKEYPKTFVWACEDDDMVPVSNSIRMGKALDVNGVENKVCIYPSGGHGCGLACNTSAEGWIEEVMKFMK